MRGLAQHCTRQGTCELGAVLEAAVRAPGLRALRLYVPTADVRHSRVLARAVSMAARLRVLELPAPRLAYHDICALAMMPGLSRLAVHPARRLKFDPRLAALLEHHAAEGLRITLDARPHKSAVMQSDDGTRLVTPCNADGTRAAPGPLAACDSSATTCLIFALPRWCNIIDAHAAVAAAVAAAGETRPGHGLAFGFDPFCWWPTCKLDVRPSIGQSGSRGLLPHTAKHTKSVTRLAVGGQRWASVQRSKPTATHRTSRLAAGSSQQHTSCSCWRLSRYCSWRGTSPLPRRSHDMCGWVADGCCLLGLFVNTAKWGLHLDWLKRLNNMCLALTLPLVPQHALSTCLHAHASHLYSTCTRSGLCCCPC